MRDAPFTWPAFGGLLFLAFSRSDEPDGTLRRSRRWLREPPQPKLSNLACTWKALENVWGHVPWSGNKHRRRHANASEARKTPQRGGRIGEASCGSGTTAKRTESAPMWDKINAICTMVIAVATVVYVIFTIRILRTMNDTLTEMRRANEIADRPDDGQC